MVRTSKKKTGATSSSRRAPAPLRLRFRTWINIGDTALLGQGRAHLLEAIESCGSISAAAREVGMSYHKAWDSIRAVNTASPCPVVEMQTGGHRGGGATLTEFGRSLLDVFHAAGETLEQGSKRAQTQLDALERSLPGLSPKKRGGR